jgi:tetratricopeptide (TPR) repeat protein
MIKKAKAVIFLLLLSFLFFLNTSAYGINIPVGAAAPDFFLKSLDGEFVTLEDYKGSILVFLYWNPEQERSLLAVDDWLDLFGKYREKGVGFISIIPEPENYEDVRKMVEEKKIGFPVMIDKGRKVFGSYEVRVYPSTVFISRDGKIAHDLPGHPLTYKSKTEGYLMYMLGEIGEEGLKDMLSPSNKAVDEALAAAEKKYNMALRYLESGLVELAVHSVKSSIEAKPDLIKSHILLGFLFIDMKEADDAVGAFKEALELNPDSHDAKTGLGGALILKGDIDGAIELLKEAARLNPYPQKAYYELGKAYELKGEKDKAAEMYRKVFEKAKGRNILPSKVFKCR